MTVASFNVNPRADRSAVVLDWATRSTGDCKAVVGKYPFHCQQRQIGKMLVIDRVELVLREQSQEMGKLERRHSVGFEQKLETGDEIVDVWHMRQHVVGNDEVCGPSLLHQPERGLCPEERYLVHGGYGFNNVLAQDGRITAVIDSSAA